MNNLDSVEMQEIHGGLSPLVTVGLNALIGITLGNIIAGWSDFKQGMQEGYNHQLAQK